MIFCIFRFSTFHLCGEMLVKDLVDMNYALLVLVFMASRVTIIVDYLICLLFNRVDTFIRLANNPITVDQLQNC